MATTEKKRKLTCYMKKVAPWKRRTSFGRNHFQVLYIYVNFSVVYGELMLDWCTGFDWFHQPPKWISFCKRSPISILYSLFHPRKFHQPGPTTTTPKRGSLTHQAPSRSETDRNPTAPLVFPRSTGWPLHQDPSLHR